MISVLITTYNRSRLLNQCLISVINQTYKDIEIIILDDHSVDDTEKVVKEFQLKDKRIKYFRNAENITSKKGYGENVKTLIYKLMTKKYFVYLTDDDYWPDSSFLERAKNILQQNINLSHLIGSQMNEEYEDEKVLKILTIEEVNILKQNINKKYYFHHNLLPTGLYTAEYFLDEFSNNATKFNLSCGAHIFKKEGLEKFNYLSYKNLSRWQSGYEFKIPPLFIGDVYYLNEPQVITRTHRNCASFNITQKKHYLDSLLAVDNAFSVMPENNKFIKKKSVLYYKKQFIKSISVSYLLNTLHILRYNKLTLNSEENIKEYVSIGLCVKIFFKYKIYLYKKEDFKLIKYFIDYIFLKISNRFFSVKI